MSGAGTAVGRPPSWRLAFLLVLVVVAAGPACGRSRPGPPNVVLVVVDTLRPDALGCYGAATPTPHVDAVAAGGLRFTRALAQAPWTIPSVASLVTSLYPVEHGQGTATGPPEEPLVTLAERLRAAGYTTGAFLELSTPLLRQGFETFEVPVGTTDERYARAARDAPYPTFARALQWLRRGPRRPFFLMVHTYEVHDYFLGKPRARQYALARHPSYRGPFLRWRPRPPAEATGEALFADLLAADEEDVAFARSLYDGGVQVVDGEVGRLDAALEELGLAESTVVVLTSDHGEGFSPRLRRVSHGGRLHDDLLHVPLLIRWPGHVAPGVERAPVRSVDIAPTLLRLAGVLPPTPGASASGEGMRGTPLLAPRGGLGSLLLGDRWRAVGGPERPAFAEESAFLVLPSGMRVRSTVRQVALSLGDRKLIRVGGDEELFDLARDPSETRNLVSARPAVASAMRGRLDRFLGDLGTGGAGPAEDLEDALRALGYVE